MILCGGQGIVTAIFIVNMRDSVFLGSLVMSTFVFTMTAGAEFSILFSSASLLV